MSIGKTRLEYRVVRHLGQWRIEYDRQHFGPYASQQEAVRYADRGGSQGRPARRRGPSPGPGAQRLVRGRMDLWAGSLPTRQLTGSGPYPKGRQSGGPPSECRWIEEEVTPAAKPRTPSSWRGVPRLMSSLKVPSAGNG